jgi:2',3'-cyclic-nucleotide 2'-phosphodiesterase (5'-nucleotidase family)
MRRLFISLSVFLILFSCAPHLSVHQINTKNFSVDTQNSSIDSMAQVIVKPFRDSIANDMSKLIAITGSALIKGKPESKLTNFSADVFLEYGTKYCNKMNLKINPDASYVNYGGLRASLPQGNITVGHVFELMPFENEIVLVKISGESLVKMAERIASRGGEGVSGLTIGIKNEKPVVLKVNGKPVDLAASYWIVTNDYIANGGDQMSMFANPIERIDSKLKLRDMLIQALSERYKRDGIIDVKLDGRIYNEQ